VTDETRPAGSPGRCGTVALVGWTNVGKSTLLNRLVGERIAAVADVAQTTRNRITGVLHVEGRGQIVFVDTPGLHPPRHEMNRAMVELARRAVHGVDLALLLADAGRGLGDGDREAAALLERAGVERLMVLNKIDRVRPKTKLLPLMRTAVEEWGFAEALPVSALSGEGCDTLIERVLARLPLGPPLYPDDFLTDQTERSLAAEYIREKLLARTRQELPHATAVLTERWVERDDGLVEIQATILVDRESQKPIVIGRGGELLKNVGADARAELERFLDRRVFLRLWVKVREDWRNDDRTLHQLGLRDLL
jgi:GTP-binding protein Era